MAVQDTADGSVGTSPVTLADVRRRWPALLPIAVVVPLMLGLAAAVDGGRLLVWDEPITNAAISHRQHG